MANTHVENAILRLQDQTSSRAAKMNRELRKLYNTMKLIDSASDRIKPIKINSAGIVTATNRIKRLRNLASKPIVVKTRTTGGGSSGGSTVSNVPVSGTPTRKNNQGFGGRVLREAGRIAIYSAVFTVGSAVINTVATGSRERDIADDAIAFANLGKTQEDLLRKISANIAKNNLGLSQTQIAQSILEVAPATGFDVGEAGKAIGAMMPLVQQMLRAGDADAVDSADRILRTLATTGQITKKDGTLDDSKLAGFIEVMQQVQGTMKKQFTPELIETVVKRAQSAKLTLDKEGLRGLLILGEELKAQAGVGLNQAIKNLSGRTTKAALSNQAALGLTSTREIEVGKTGGKTRTKKVFAGVENERLLRENLFEWVRTVLLPKVDGKNLLKIPELADLGKFDASDPVHAAKLAQSITSDRTAITMLTSAITRANELQRDIQVQKEQFDLSRGSQDQQNLNSQTLNIQNAANKIIDAVGSVANAFEGPLNSALRGVADVANSISTFVNTGAADERAARAGAVVKGGIVAGGAVALGLKKLIGKFGLKSSATALKGSAVELNRAASALQRAAKKQNSGSNPKEKNSKPKSKKKRSSGGGGSDVLGGAGLVGGTVATVVATSNELEVASTAIGDFTAELVGGKEGVKRNREIQKNNNKIMADFVRGIFGFEKSDPTARIKDKVDAQNERVYRQDFERQQAAIIAEMKKLAGAEDVADPRGVFQIPEVMGLTELPITLEAALDRANAATRVSFESGTASVTSGIDGSMQRGATALSDAITSALSRGVKVIPVPAARTPDTGSVNLRTE